MIHLKKYELIVYIVIDTLKNCQETNLDSKAKCCHMYVYKFSSFFLANLCVHCHFILFIVNFRIWR